MPGTFLRLSDRTNDINLERLPRLVIGNSGRPRERFVEFNPGYVVQAFLKHDRSSKNCSHCTHRNPLPARRGEPDHCPPLSPAYTSHAPSAQTPISTASIPWPATALFGRSRSDDGDKRFTIVAPIRKPPTSTLAAR